MGNKRLPLLFQGKEYPALRALARELGIDHKTLKRRIDTGVPEEDWGKQQAPLPTYTREQLQELLNQRLSFPEIAKRLGTTPSGIEHRVARWGLSRPPALYEQLTKEVLLEAMEQGLSKQELAKQYGFDSSSPVTDACALHALEWNPRKVYRPRTQGQNLTAVTYQGKQYASIKSLASEMDISYNTLVSRINNGWPEKDWANPLKKLDVDITDQRFGRLVAVRLTQRGSAALHQGQMWLFRCDCGREVEIDKSRVMQGNTKSCGCLRSELVSDRWGKKHKTGEVFGELTVLGPAGRGGDHGQRLMWKCQCSCGKVVTVTGKNLRSGNTQSCGHLAGTRDDLTGKTFNRLTVTDLVLANPGSGGQRIWLCSCSCGNTVEVPTASLVNANTKSCGCLKTETAVLNFRNEGAEAYRIDPEYASRESYVYLVEVAGVIDKLGIAFDLDARGRAGNYTEFWWTYELTRAQCWAVEQVALSLTKDWAPKEPYYDEHGHSGPSEQRTGWCLDEIIPMMNSLCKEVVKLDWENFLAKYGLL